MTITETVQAWTKERRANKGAWVFFHADYNGRPIAVKSFNTSIQIARAGRKGEPGTITDTGPIDARVRDAEAFLRSFLESAMGAQEFGATPRAGADR